MGKLPSVAYQRQIQRRVIGSMLSSGSRMAALFIGCGFGDEIGEVLTHGSALRGVVDLTAIDLTNVRASVISHAPPSMEIEFVQTDFMAPSWNRGRRFDLVQCGFVLHDVPAELKQDACRRVYDLTAPGGASVISDIFVSQRAARSEVGYRRAVREIYRQFIREADAARESAALRQSEWAELVGDSISPGLTRTAIEAEASERDWFETRDGMARRMRHAGFVRIEFHQNPMNRSLSVLVCRR